MREITFGQAMVEALDEEMERDERVFIMGEDVGRFGMIYVANRKLYEKYGDERMRDTPICENAIVGFALGAAITGMRPVAEIMFCDLLTLAMEQIVNQAAKIRYMFGGNIKIVSTPSTKLSKNTIEKPPPSETTPVKSKITTQKTISSYLLDSFIVDNIKKKDKERESAVIAKKKIKEIATSK